MPTLQLAANLIANTSAAGFNWGHLQIVFGNEEIEVQAPYTLEEYAAGEYVTFAFPSIRNHAGNTDYYGAQSANYRSVNLDLGERKDVDVWNLLENIHTVFRVENPNYLYGLGQNSNSYAMTLLWMTGISVGLESVTPSNVIGATEAGIDLIEAGSSLSLWGSLLGQVTLSNPDLYQPIPGSDRNLLTEGYGVSGSHIEFDVELTGTTGDDFFRTGTGDDIFVGGAGDDSFVAGDGDDQFSGGQGDDIFNGQTGSDLIDYSGSLFEGDTAGGNGIHATATISDVAGNDISSMFIVDTWGSQDLATNVEAITGSAQDDVLSVAGNIGDIGVVFNGMDAGSEGIDGDTIDLSSAMTSTSAIQIDLAGQTIDQADLGSPYLSGKVISDIVKPAGFCPEKRNNHFRSKKVVFASISEIEGGRPFTLRYPKSGFRIHFRDLSTLRKTG